MSCNLGIRLFLLLGMMVSIIPLHCKGDECSWEVTENRSAALGFTITNGIWTLGGCQDICTSQPVCVAVIYGGRQCKTFTSEPAVEAASGWTYAVRNCTNGPFTTTSPTTRTSRKTTTTTTTTPSSPPTPSIPPSGQTSTKSTLISTVSTVSTRTQSTEDSPANEATGVSVAVIAGVVGATVVLIIVGIIVIFIVMRKKSSTAPNPGHPAAGNAKNRGHRMATVTDNSNTTDRVTPAAEHHRTDGRDPASTTQIVYEITEESSHYYDPLSHWDNTYINDSKLYTNPVFAKRGEGGGTYEDTSTSGGQTTYYNTGVQTNDYCNSNTTYRNMSALC